MGIRWGVLSIVWSMVLSLGACRSPPIPPSAVARIELGPTGQLLRVGDTHAMSVHAFDAAGGELDVAITLAIEGAGIEAEGTSIRALAVGSALIRAQAGDITSQPVTAIAMEPADGAMLIDDDAIAQPPAVADADLERFSVVLRDVDPPIGAIVMASGATPLAGRVVSTSRGPGGVTVVFESASIDELFAQVDLDLSIPVTLAVARTPFAALQIGPFTCDVDLDPSVLSGDFTLERILSLTVDWKIRRSRLRVEEVRVAATLTSSVTASGSLEIAAQLGGTLDCKVDGPAVPIPTGTGVLDFLARANYTPQLGASLDAQVGSKVSIGFEGSFGSKRTLGFDWTPSGISWIHEGTDTHELQPHVASEGLFFDAEVFAYLGAELRVEFAGGLLGKKGLLDIARLRLGPQLTIDYSGEAAQVADPMAASGYQIDFVAKLEAGDSIDKFIKRITHATVSLPSVTYAVPIDASPTGTLTASVEDIDVTSGQSVELQVGFAAGSETFLGLPDIDRVVFYRLLDDGSLEQVGTDLATSPDQRVFSTRWTPSDATTGDQVFAAFVVPKLLSVVPLEVADDSRVHVDVHGPVCGDGHCTGSETTQTCPSDCPDRCGDGLCTGAETHETCPGDCSQVELCNHHDDNGDGSIDEGFVYAETPGSRHTIHEPDSAAAWWATGNGAQAAFSWVVGPGTVADVVRVQVTDLAGTEIGAPLTLSTYQPSNWNALSWMTDRFVQLGTMRSYACATCTTYSAGISATGALSNAAAPIINGAPWTGGLFSAGGEFFVTTQAAEDTTGAIRVRTFDRLGQAGAVDRTLLTPTTGTISYIIRGAASGSEIYWLYMSSVDGLRLLVTDLTAVPIRGPYTLDATGAIQDRHAPPLAVVNGTLLILVRDGGTTYLGRWDTTGGPLGPMTPITSLGGRSTLAVNGDEVYVLTDGPNPSLARLSITGALVQPPTALPFAGDYCAIVAVPDGAIVVAGQTNGHDLVWSHLGCP